jgi:DNA-binding transcriptional LysR family regulator
MDIRRLELLRELADRGSVGAVARAAGRTPSAVSQQLKVLEREAGVPLTERSGRGIVLTDAGRALARTATDIAVAVARAEALWEDFRHQPSGEVTLATFPTAAQMLLPGLLDRVARIPDLTIRASDRDPASVAFADLTADFDVVIAHSLAGAGTWRGLGLVIVPLMVEPLDVAMPADHRLAGRASVSPSDLSGEPWIGVPQGLPFDRILLDIEQAVGAPARVVQRFSDTRITESLVAAGHGIALLPRYTAGEHDDVVVKRLTGVASKRHLHVLLRPDRAERPSVRAVVDALREEARGVDARFSGNG